MKLDLSIWLPLRLILLASNVAMVLQISLAPNASSDWWQCIGPIIASGFLFMWLLVVKPRNDADISDPYTLTGPFFPFGQYPLRFWFTASLMLIVAGSAASIVELLSHQRMLPIDVMFLLWGLSTLCVVVVHVRISGARRRSV